MKMKRKNLIKKRSMRENNIFIYFLKYVLNTTGEISCNWKFYV